MTTPYTTGQISLVNGSAMVTGVGTGWETALIIGGTIFVEAAGNPLPIAEISSDTAITAAIAWTGTTGTYDYALVRDTAYGQQTVANAQALADYIQRLNSTALSAISGVAPASETVLMFTGPDTATTISVDDIKSAGDVVGPSGGVTAKQITGFGSTTGKAIVGLTAAEARAASSTPVGNFRNKIINPLFSINQRAVSGTVNLAAGAYGHDRMKAGSGGCTYTFSANNGVTTMNITAGSLQQVVEASSFAGEAGSYVLSWAGTAQGRINGGSYGASGAVTATIDGSANATVEFNTGTVSLPKLEKDYVTPFSPRHRQQEFALCQRYFQKTYQEDVAPGAPLSVPGLVEGRGDGGNYAVLGTFSLNVWMRSAPSITIYNYATGAVGTGRLASNNTDVPVASSLAGSRGVKIYVNNAQTPATGADIQVHFTANSEI